MPILHKILLNKVKIHTEGKRKNVIGCMFVCLGNICRSPMAESVMSDLVQKSGIKGRVFVASSATSNEQIGDVPYYATQEKLRKEGIPLVPHRAVRLTEEDGDKYDYFLCMDEYNLRDVRRILGERNAHKAYLLLSFAGESRAVADPWYTRDFDCAYADILRGCKGLLRYIEGVID